MNESHLLRQRDPRPLRFLPLWSGLLILALVAGGCTTSSGQLMTALGQADLGVNARPDDAAPGSEEAAVPGVVAPAAAPILVARILADRLNVRSDPTTEASVVGKLFVGNEVTVLDRADDGAWIQVQVDGVDTPAWISAQFAEVIEMTPVPAAESATEAAAAAVLLPTPTPGDEPAPTSKLAASAPEVPTAFTQPDRMNVRAGPGTGYPVVATVAQGTALEILALGPTGEWYQVTLPDRDEPAYVFAGLTTPAGPLDDLPQLAEDDVPPPPAPQAVVAASAAPVNAPPPAGGGFFGYGVQAHMLGGGIDAAVNATANLGFNWIKQQVEWRNFEGSQGAIDFSELRRVVDAAGGRGINVLVSVVNAPDWAREPGFDTSVGGPPADPQTYAAFVGRLAGEFCGSGLKAIEVWNEQNLHYEWGNKPLNPADYMNLLRAAYGSIKGACPSMLVISGALTPAGDAGPYARDDFAYLEGMYQNGLARYADGIGVHPSGYNVPPSVGWQEACAVIQQTGNFFNGPCDTPHHSWSFRSTMEGYRNIMVVYGDANKRLWPTEFGWAVGPAVNGAYAYANDNSADEQAAWTVEAFQMMRSWGWVGPAFLWNLNFRVVADGTEKAQWGIVRNDYSPLPVYEALRAMPK